VAGVLSAVTLACDDSGLVDLPAGQVGVHNNFFNPATLNHDVGVPLTWVFFGNTNHNVTFEDGVGNSANMVTGEHTRTFSVATTYRYRCTFHSNGFAGPGMVGSVVVTP
jgi:plastocyanin